VDSSGLFERQHTQVRTPLSSTSTINATSRPDGFGKDGMLKRRIRKIEMSVTVCLMGRW
jgi:hypothetical protein